MRNVQGPRTIIWIEWAIYLLSYSARGGDAPPIVVTAGYCTIIRFFVGVVLALCVAGDSTLLLMMIPGGHALRIGYITVQCRTP